MRERECVCERERERERRREGEREMVWVCIILLNSQLTDIFNMLDMRSPGRDTSYVVTK